MKGKVNQLYQNFFIQFRLDFRDNMTQSDSSIKILTSQVQEDGKLKRVIEAYVEEGGRDLICIPRTLEILNPLALPLTIKYNIFVPFVDCSQSLF